MRRAEIDPGGDGSRPRSGGDGIEPVQPLLEAGTDHGVRALEEPMTRVMSVFGPVFVQVTLVPSPSGWRAKVVVLDDLKALRN